MDELNKSLERFEVAKERAFKALKKVFPIGADVIADCEGGHQVPAKVVNYVADTPGMIVITDGKATKMWFVSSVHPA